MAEPGRGGEGAVSTALPEKRIFIRSDQGAGYVRLSTALAAFAATAGLGLAVWVALVGVDIAAVRPAALAQGPAELQEAYAARLDAVLAERDARAAEAAAAQKRFREAMDQIGRQQAAILDAFEGRTEVESALAVTRDRLGETDAALDAAEASAARLAEELAAERQAEAGAPSGADLTATLAAVTEALSGAVVDRDAAAEARDTLTTQLAAAELDKRIAERRQEEMIGQLRDAVADSSGPMEQVLQKVGLDVDSVLATVRPAYSGQGGPLLPIGLSSRSYPADDPVIGRFDELMVDVDRMSLLRTALGKVPYAMPVHDSHRFTSGFGVRSDPKGRGRRMHTGVDFAAPQGTPIYASADGVVIKAGRESGYGLAVRVKHEFGFETVYAHMSRARVQIGQRVSRGDRLGDMGRTGRATGVHLHYEVRLNGRPVNPMTYVEAAKDVF